MTTDAFIPLSRPTIEDQEIAEVVDSLTSGWITTGPKVAQLEALFCQRLNIEQCLAVNSGTAAWHVLAHAMNLGPGDEVIMPAITWPSIANVVELLGAKVVLADVDGDTVLMPASEVERLLSPRTKAIIPVHYAGMPADIDAYKAVIGQRNILIVEDAAHALGAEYKARPVGSLADAAIFSFHPTKNITTGEGGLLVCKDAALLARARKLSLHGIGKSAWERVSESSAHYDLDEPGYKYNMLDIQAALGIHQLPKLDAFISIRTAQAHRYHRLLEGMSAVKPIADPDYPYKHAWHIYAVQLDLPALGVSRNNVIAQLKSQQVGVGVHFEAIHQLAYYRKKYGYKPDDLSNASRLGACLISLPLFPRLTVEQQEHVVKALRNIAS